MFEHLAVSVAQLTLDCRLLTANSHLCELLGRSKQELIQKDFKEFFLPEGLWPECEAGLDRLIAGGIRQYSTNMSAVRTDGKPVWVNVVFSLVRDRCHQLASQSDRGSKRYNVSYASHAEPAGRGSGAR